MTPLPTGEMTMNTSRYAKTLRWVAAGLAFTVTAAFPRASWTAVAQAQTPAGGAQQAGMEPTDGQKAAAGLMNVFHVPGKAIVCGVGTASTIAVLLLSFGSAHRVGAPVFAAG